VPNAETRVSRCKERNGAAEHRGGEGEFRNSGEGFRAMQGGTEKWFKIYVKTNRMKKFINNLIKNTQIMA